MMNQILKHIIKPTFFTVSREHHVLSHCWKEKNARERLQEHAKNIHVFFVKV